VAEITTEKPSYLSLLNGISLAETRGHCWLNAWIEKTPNPEVRKVLQTISAREGEHGMAFAKRINELGFELEQKDDPKFEEQMAIASADCSDLEKFEALGLTNVNEGILTYFDNAFSDHSIDIRTGELLGRYIAEEHDTGRLFKSCYEQLKAAGTNANGSAELSALNAKVDALCAAVEQLQDTISAQGDPVANGKNGKSRAKTAAH
jgi:rubrerythrin